MPTYRTRALCLLLCAWLLCAIAPVVRADVPEGYVQSDLRRRVTMPNGAGPYQYYAQNDPIWERSIYEASRSSSLRLFGDGGCNPTSLAMVVASLVPPEYLGLIAEESAKHRDFSLCSCSVSSFFCQEHKTGRLHTPTPLVTGWDYLSVLPLVFGNYATGNNPTFTMYRLAGAKAGANGGTSTNLFAPIAQAYGLTYTMTRSERDIYATLDRGGMAIALSSGRTQIFSGSNGHYLVICSYDDTYLYILDPYVRDTYTKDRHHVIEKVEPGVLKIRRDSLARTGIGNYALFEPAPPTYYAERIRLLRGTGEGEKAPGDS